LVFISKNKKRKPLFVGSLFFTQGFYTFCKSICLHKIPHNKSTFVENSVEKVENSSKQAISSLNKPVCILHYG